MLVAATPRLVLKEFTHGDAPFILELVNSAGWLRYIGDRNVHSIEDAIDYLDKGPLKSYADNGFGLWRVDLRTTGEPIGMCGLIRRSDLEGPDIGFAFLPDYQGQGYGSEASQATIAVVRDRLRLPELFAIVQPDNDGSIALLKKNGFLYDKVVISGAKMEPLQLYRLSLV